MEKGTHAMLALLETAKKAAIPAKYLDMTVDELFEIQDV